MMQQQVAELLPKREGHFVFGSGHHGEVWLDLERLLLHPERVETLASFPSRIWEPSACPLCAKGVPLKT